MNKPQSRTKFLLNAALATFALAGLGVWMTPPSAAQSSAKGKGTVEKIKIHGTALEGNLEGDSPDRDVLVYLPPATPPAPRATIRCSTSCTATAPPRRPTGT